MKASAGGAGTGKGHRAAEGSRRCAGLALPSSGSLASRRCSLRATPSSSARGSVRGAVPSRCFYFHSLTSVRGVSVNVCTSFPSPPSQWERSLPKARTDPPLAVERGLIQGTPGHAEP